jgi:hypothetical protein
MAAEHASHQAHAEGAHAPLSRVGDKLPNAMSPGDLMRALNLGERTFYNLQAAGKFTRFELPRPIGRKRYSGRLVERYLAAGK